MEATTTTDGTGLEFASPAWVQRIGEILRQVHEEYRRDGRLGDETWTFTQEFRDVPPDRRVAGWGAVISPSGVEFHPVPMAAELGLRGTWEAVLPIARFEFGAADDRSLAEIMGHWEDKLAVDELENIGDVFGLLLSGTPQATMILELHDRQARELS